MAADAEGNDIGAVGVPITGFAAVQLTGTPTYVDSADGADTPLVLPTGYQKVGLFKVDGGPQEGGDAGEAIEFFQQGYKLAGDDQPTIQINLAQFDALVRKLITGQTPDANGMVVIKGLTPDHTFPLFVTTKYKNGWSERKNGLARISAVEPDQKTRGEVAGRAVTFEWIYDETIGGFCRDWLVPPAGSAQASSFMTQTTLLTQDGQTLVAPTAYPAGAPSEEWTHDQIDAYAAANGIDLSGASTKADKLAIIAGA